MMTISLKYKFKKMGVIRIITLQVMKMNNKLTKIAIINLKFKIVNYILIIIYNIFCIR